MSERQAPWWAHQPAPEMTRSERAAWTDMQVLAFLWAEFEESGSSPGEPMTTRAVAAALGLTVGRAAHALRRLRWAGHAARDEFGWFSKTRAREVLAFAGYAPTHGPIITYPCDSEAA